MQKIILFKYTLFQVAEELYSASRPVKSVFLADTGNILTTGFSRNGTREVALWDSVSTHSSAYL